MTIRLACGTALVTGGSRGIGRGIALRLAECGIEQIAVHYHQNRDAAEQTMNLIQDRGAKCLLVRGDLTRAEDVERVVRTVGDEFGVLDVFVSNARSELGRFYEPVMSLSLEQWQDAIDGQARAFLVGVREATRFMTDGIGRVVAITYAPGSATGSWQPWAAMGAAKSALESLCRYFAGALASRGITVNAVSPGLTDDSVLNGLPPEVFTLIKERCESGWTPMRRMTTPRDVGNAVSLLCSAEAGFITGQVLHCDGGASTSLPDLPMQLQAG
jgi:NAD(P)-dependent dehydrogenase (short-subunit alcohol dehydrogenase family)